MVFFSYNKSYEISICFKINSNLKEKKGGDNKCKSLLKKHGASIKTYKNGRQDLIFTKKKEKEYDKLIKKDFKKGLKVLLDLKKACSIDKKEKKGGGTRRISYSYI